MSKDWTIESKDEPKPAGYILQVTAADGTTWLLNEECYVSKAKAESAKGDIGYLSVIPFYLHPDPAVAELREQLAEVSVYAKMLLEIIYIHRHCAEIPPHKMADAEFLRACLANIRAYAKDGATKPRPKILQED